MVRFGKFLDAAVAHKPEWANAFLDYDRLVTMLDGGMDPTQGDSAYPFEHQASRAESSCSRSTKGYEASMTVTDDRPLPANSVPADHEELRVEDEINAPDGRLLRAHGRVGSGDSLDCLAQLCAVGAASSPKHAVARDAQHACSPKPLVHRQPSPKPQRWSGQFSNSQTQSSRQAPEPVDWSPEQDGMEETGADQLKLIMSPARMVRGTVAPHDFRDAFFEEFDKVRSFYLRSVACYEDFFTVKRPRWSGQLSAGSGRDRVRTNVGDLHRELCHLAHYIDVNIVAVLKVLKKAKKRLRADDDVPRAGTVIGQGDKRLNKRRIDDLKREVEAFFCEHFAGGDMHQAMLSLLGGPAWGFPLFAIGLLLGLTIAGVLYGVHVTLELTVPAHDAEMWWRVFPCLRPFFFAALCSVFWSLDLYIYQRFRINHAYILELQPGVNKRQQWPHSLCLGLAGLLTWVWMMDIYIRAGIDARFYYTGFHEFQKWCLPILMILWFLLYASHWRQLRPVAETARNVFVLPYPLSVRFRDFFLADWLTSLTLAMGDVEYMVCYFSEAGRRGQVQPEPRSIENADEWPDCRPHNAKYHHFLAIFAFLWRLAQCLHMYRRTRRKAHLINAGKYCCLLGSDAICILAVLASGSKDGTHWPVFWMSCVAKTYAYAWDILMDWGFAGFAGVPGFEPRRTTFRRWVYVAAGAFNLAARFAFTIPYIPGVETTAMLTTALGVVELSRRMSWSVFRIENENVNNLEKYRSVDYVPEVDARADD